MRRRTLFSLPFTPLMLRASSEDGFQPLVASNSLDGWDGDPRLWSVTGGVIHGSTKTHTIDGNTFLIYRRRNFTDFTLRSQVKINGGNSGIQFRSEALDNWVVKGLQCDMAEGNWWGSVYDEKGTRGIIVNGWKGKAETVIKAGDWNDVELHCSGPLVEVRINGLLTAKLENEQPRAGVIALQLHRGPAMEVWFKDLRIKAAV